MPSRLVGFVILTDNSILHLITNVGLVLSDAVLCCYSQTSGMRIRLLERGPAAVRTVFAVCTDSRIKAPTMNAGFVAAV